MRSERTKFVVMVYATAAESKAFGCKNGPHRLMFDPVDGEYLGACGMRHSTKPSKALVDLARDFVEYEVSQPKQGRN